ncbi:ParB/RepB/Spo0J family partition protein [Streptomyces sp. NPDC055085]
MLASSLSSQAGLEAALQIEESKEIKNQDSLPRAKEEKAGPAPDLPLRRKEKKNPQSEIEYLGWTLVLVDSASAGFDPDDVVAQIKGAGEKYIHFEKSEQAWYYTGFKGRKVAAAPGFKGHDYRGKEYYNYIVPDDAAVTIIDIADIEPPVDIEPPAEESDSSRLSRLDGVRNELKLGADIYPIQVIKISGEYRYRIIQGRHRFRASQEARFTKIPAILA